MVVDAVLLQIFASTLLAARNMIEVLVISNVVSWLAIIAPGALGFEADDTSNNLSDVEDAHARQMAG